MHQLNMGALAVAIGLFSVMANTHAGPVAIYSFNNTFSSSVLGAPALQPVNPLETNGFVQDSVSGHSQTVYKFTGNSFPPTDQGGLSLNTTGLLTSNSIYSVEMIFKFTQQDNAWRRIIDVQNRQSDNGFYVDPSNKLDVYPIGGGSTFTNNVYHDVFLVDNNGVVTFYLDGSSQASFNTSVMNIDSNHTMNFFLDNLVGGGQGEYSNGSIAFIQLFNEALGAPPTVSAVPEPGTIALLGVAFTGLAFTRRRRS